MQPSPYRTSGRDRVAGSLHPWAGELRHDDRRSHARRARATADLDVLLIAPREQGAPLLELGVQGGALHRKYKIYPDYVAVTKVPEEYEERLTERSPGAYEHLRICALDPYDLALSKLERNIQRDRDDVKHLAHSIPLDSKILRDRQEKELRWQLGNPEREDLTLKLWSEMIEEERSGSAGDGQP